MDEQDDILEISSSGVPLRPSSPLPPMADEIPVPVTESPPETLGKSVRASDSSEDASPASRVYGPGDGYVGRVVGTHYTGAEGATGLAQGVNVERSIVGFDTNNEPTVGPIGPASGQPTTQVVSAIPFPLRHDQAGYLVEDDEPVIVVGGRDGRQYMLNDELPFVGKVKSVDSASDTVTVVRQSLAGDPDGGGFAGATLADLQDADSDNVEVTDILCLRGTLPSTDDNILVHRRGRYYFTESGGGVQWGVATAPDARTESGSAAPAHIMPGSGSSYVYLWASDSDGTSSGTAPALSSTTEDQFVKAYWRGHPKTVNIRGGDVVSYIESDGKFWIEGDGWSDDPIYALDEWAGTSANVRTGWTIQNDDTVVVKMPSPDVDTDGTAMDLDGSGHMQDLRERTPHGAGNNPGIVGLHLAAPPPITTGEITLETFPVSAPASSFEFGFYGTQYIVRTN